MVGFIKKHLVFALAAVLFAAAFFVNIKLNYPKEKEMAQSTTETEIETETETAAAVDADYFASFRRDREEVRKTEMEYLDEVIAVSASDDETLADAKGQKLVLVENMEKEFTIESLIKAKGFEDAAVTFHQGSVNVVVKTEELSKKQVAQILEIAMKETGEPAGNIKIMTGK